MNKNSNLRQERPPGINDSRENFKTQERLLSGSEGDILSDEASPKKQGGVKAANTSALRTHQPAEENKRPLARNDEADPSDVHMDIGRDIRNDISGDSPGVAERASRANPLGIKLEGGAGEGRRRFDANSDNEEGLSEEERDRVDQIPARGAGVGGAFLRKAQRSRDSGSGDVDDDDGEDYEPPDGESQLIDGDEVRQHNAHSRDADERESHMSHVTGRSTRSDRRKKRLAKRKAKPQMLGLKSAMTKKFGLADIQAQAAESQDKRTEEPEAVLGGIGNASVADMLKNDRNLASFRDNTTGQAAASIVEEGRSSSPEKPSSKKDSMTAALALAAQSKIKDQVNIHKLQKQAEDDNANQGEPDESGEASSSSNSTYLVIILSSLFCAFFVLEFNILAVYDMSSVFRAVFMLTKYNPRTNATFLDISTVSEMKTYMQDFSLNILYNDEDKYSTNQLASFTPEERAAIVNSTEHKILGDNYFCGLRLSLKRTSNITNPDSSTLPVVPTERQKFYFNRNSDYSYENKTTFGTGGKSFSYEAANGIDLSGGFISYFAGTLTYAEASAQFQEIINQDWFDVQTLQVGVEYLFFNNNYKTSMIYQQKFFLDNAGKVDPSANTVSWFPISTYSGDSHLAKLLIIIPFIIGLFYQFIMAIVILIQFLKESYKSGNLAIPWYYYIDVVVIGLSLASVIYWFKQDAMQKTYFLPVKTEHLFYLYLEQSYSMEPFLAMSGLTLMLMSVRILRVLTIQFPAFGVLFETIGNAKKEFLFFFTMVIVWMLGCVVCAHMLFGYKVNDYADMGLAILSQFQMCFKYFAYSELEVANPGMAFLFFSIFMIMFATILQYMFLAIVMSIYDRLRRKKQLETEAKALIFADDSAAVATLWFNFFLCRMPRVSVNAEQERADAIREEIEELDYDSEDDSVEAVRKRKEHLRKKHLEAESRRNRETSTPVLTKMMLNFKKLGICQRKQTFRTKEQLEKLVTLKKMLILKKKFKEHEKMQALFNATDSRKTYKLLKASFIYMLFIIVYAVMVTLQISVEKNILAQTSMKNYIETQVFLPKSIYPGSSVVPPSYLANVSQGKEIYDWMNQSLIDTLYNSNRIIMTNNYLIGDPVCRITYRFSDVLKNDLENTKDVFDTVRAQLSIIPGDGQQTDEKTFSFTGKQSQKTYSYIAPGTSNTFREEGGYVMTFSSDINDAVSKIEQVEKDQMLDFQNFTMMAVEFATFNPNFPVYLMNQIVFVRNSAGHVHTHIFFKGINKDFYKTSIAKFRIFLEIVYVIFVVYYTILELIGLYRVWKKQTEDDNISFPGPKRDEAHSCFQRLLVWFRIDPEGLEKKSMVYLFFRFLFGIIYFILFEALKLIRVVLRYALKDMFIALNLFSIVLSYQLIVIWLVLISSNSFTVQADGSAQNHFEVLTSLTITFDSYTWLSSFNVLLIFLRILQFLSFSRQLSMFVLVIKNAGSDLMFFILMFIMVLFGFTFLAYALFGHLMVSFSSISRSFLTLFRMLQNDYDYDMMRTASIGAPVFYLAFMVVFRLLLLNMIIAIVSAHYNEVRRMMRQSEDDASKGFLTTVLTILKDNCCQFGTRRRSARKSKRKKTCCGCYCKCCNLEDENEEDDGPTDFNIQKTNFAQRLTLDEKNYKGGDRIHQFLRPYIDVEKLGKTVSEVSKGEIENLNESQEEGKDGELNKSNETDVFDPQKQLGVVNFEGGEELLTNANQWYAALELNLYDITNKDLLFSEMKLRECWFEPEEDAEILYNDKNFAGATADFLMAYSFERKTEIWRQADVEQKFELWVAMDFKRVYEEEKRIERDELLEKKSMKLYRNFLKNQDPESLSQISIFGFKLLLQAPEMHSNELSSVSQDQLDLWNLHTTSDEKFELWFGKFNSYHRVKLWNKLVFAEDYFLNLMNTKEYYREDVAYYLKVKILRKMQNRWKKEKRQAQARAASAKSEGDQNPLYEIPRTIPTELRRMYYNHKEMMVLYNMLKSRHYKVRKNQEKDDQEDHEGEKEEEKEKPQEEQKDIEKAHTHHHHHHHGDKSRKSIMGKSMMGPGAISSKRHKSIREVDQTKMSMASNKTYVNHNKVQKKLYGQDDDDGEELKRKSNNEDDEFETRSQKKHDHFQMMRRFFKLMVVGLYGDRTKRLEQVEAKMVQQFKKGKRETCTPLEIARAKWDFVNKNLFHESEERLALWHPLTLQEKLHMLVMQKVQVEVEIMMALIYEECSVDLEYFNKLDFTLERAFDNQVYRKYVHLMRMQSIERSLEALKVRNESLRQEDESIIDYLSYLQKKKFQLEQQKDQIYSSIKGMKLQMQQAEFPSGGRKKSVVDPEEDEANIDDDEEERNGESDQSHHFSDEDDQKSPSKADSRYGRGTGVSITKSQL